MKLNKDFLTSSSLSGAWSNSVSNASRSLLTATSSAALPATPVIFSVTVIFSKIFFFLKKK
jgi:hypothetical protein